jgi:RHS repeat-associated protein
VGNRLNKNTTTRLVGTVANNTNQAIIIDAAGNITNDGIRKYTYTAGNQLSSILVNNITTQYTYDMNNRRVSKASGTNSTAYTYAEDIGEGNMELSATSLLGEYTATATKEYVYLGDTPIAVVQAGNILTVQTDHLDTPRQLTDNTKKVVWNWAYSAFGENQPTNTNNTVFNLRYPGQYYDVESKLHYNINRYYDPATGRYTQSDPIGLSGGINTYTYVGGNSIRWSDPWGLNYMCDQAGLSAWCEPPPCICPEPPEMPELLNMCQEKSELDKNIAEAEKQVNPKWFYNKVRNKGPWDYKQKNRNYADFGNFNYGATGYAMGFPKGVLLRMAGWAQTKAGSSKSWFGKPYDFSGPYGDDPDDQNQIENGINYVRCGCQL